MRLYSLTLVAQQSEEEEGLIGSSTRIRQD